MKRFKILLPILFLWQIQLFAQSADSTQKELHAWNLLNGYLIQPAEFDTLIADFHILNPIERFSISNLYLGMPGSPWKSNIYSNCLQVPVSDFFFDRHYHLNLLTVENQTFYHAKRPYINLHWTSAPKERAENLVNAVYTQNINQKLNVGLRYRLIAAGGEYPRAIVSQHSINLFTSYKGEKYAVHAALVRNKIRANENGGITDSIIDPEFAQPLISDASSVYYKRSFFISQQYKFGFTQKIVIDDTTSISNFKEAGRLNYIIRFDKNYRVYKDDKPAGGYYENIYIDSTRTMDSIHMSRLENSFYWSFKEIEKENFKGRFSLGSTFEHIKWSTIDESDTVYQSKLFQTIKLFANLSARTRNFEFTVDGSYYLKGTDGYKQSNYEGNLLISKSINIFKLRTSFYAKLRYQLNSPDLYVQKYRSNHFRWKNNFSDVFSSNARFGIDIHKIKLNAELLNGIVKNYIYFGENALPAQQSDLLNVLSFSLSKVFKFGIFGSVNKVVYQLPNSNVHLRLPEWSAYHSMYLDKTFEKIDVQVQFGYDFNFSSTFMASGYMPANGVFYLAENEKTGNYAIANVFLKLRIKSVLIFTKMEHLNNQFLLDKYYFLLDNYPAAASFFKFGVSWRFRD